MGGCKFLISCKSLCASLLKTILLDGLNKNKTWANYGVNLCSIFVDTFYLITLGPA